MPTTTVMFTDVVGSTPVLADASEDTGVGRMTSHLQLCRSVVERHGGRVAKSLGDGVMALFDSSYAAVLAAVDLQQTIEFDGRVGGQGLEVRIGLHVGEVITAAPVEEEDVFGMAVVIARRLCDGAAGGQIFVSDLVRQLVGERVGTTFQAVAEPLESLPQPMLVHEALWDPLPETPPLRVVIAEDASLIRAGLVRLLADEGFDVIADVGDRDTLLAAVREDPPDLVITDIRMPPTHTDEGLTAAVTIRDEFPHIAVLVLSQHVEPAAAVTLLAGTPTAVGYLLKERVSEIDEFVEACRTVAQGGSVIDPIVTTQLLERRRTTDTLDRLSDRERDVLSLMAQGKSNRAIAAELHCSDKTVETHVRAIFTKLDLSQDADENRRVAAVVRWLHAAS